MFDLGRDVVNDHVFIDTVSQKLIIAGPLSGKSAYNQLSPGSARATSKPTSTSRQHYAYSGTHILRDGGEGCASCCWGFLSLLRNYRLMMHFLALYCLWNPPFYVL